MKRVVVEALTQAAATAPCCCTTAAPTRSPDPRCAAGVLASCWLTAASAPSHPRRSGCGPARACRRWRGGSTKTAWTCVLSAACCAAGTTSGGSTPAQVGGLVFHIPDVWAGKAAGTCSKGAGMRACNRPGPAGAWAQCPGAGGGRLPIAAARGAAARACCCLCMLRLFARKPLQCCASTFPASMAALWSWVPMCPPTWPPPTRRCSSTASSRRQGAARCRLGV
jgi:hypothetical protein